ncbi:hypothetical protein [Ralstonia phage RSP15]|uniref:hypothetical protein n=1 Tax=Ralstonia phage RSP15 TaxID=1785960 RepID=UPI00074D3793|nr:hypothetical protein BH754_gp025 [Ralstonia phage RSP15]BAU39983.1 hypothetical protein [Ralstonia phage RSP15]
MSDIIKFTDDNWDWITIRSEEHLNDLQIPYTQYWNRPTKYPCLAHFGPTMCNSNGPDFQVMTYIYNFEKEEV